MDNRLFDSGASVTPPTAPAVPSAGYPTNGDPLAPVPPTYPGAYWFHQIGEELRAVLTAGSVTPDDSTLTQVYEALRNLFMIPSVQDFRLTLSNGAPVPFSDITAATTLYFAPYKGNRIGLYDGTKWVLRSTAQISIAIPAVANKVYDAFVYDNAGTPTLELTAWTDDTTRAAALAYQDGVLVKSGATTRRYVGTIATTSVAGQSEDSSKERYVWNMNNRVQRTGRVYDATATWTYTTNVYRQANNNAANQFDFVRGLNDDAVFAEVATGVTNTTANVPAFVSIGLDSTTVQATGVLQAPSAPNGSTASVVAFAIYNGMPTAGRHSLTWLENSVATGTCTWYGTAIRGMTASLMM